MRHLSLRATRWFVILGTMTDKGNLTIVVRRMAQGLSMDPLPRIDLTLCTGCHRCVDVCPTQALDQRHGKAYLRYPLQCTYCTACEDVCPTDAIGLPFLIVLSDRPRRS